MSVQPWPKLSFEIVVLFIYLFEIVVLFIYLHHCYCLYERYTYLYAAFSCLRLHISFMSQDGNQTRKIGAEGWKHCKYCYLHVKAVFGQGYNFEAVFQSCIMKLHSVVVFFPYLKSLTRRQEKQQNI